MKHLITLLLMLGLTSSTSFSKVLDWKGKPVFKVIGVVDTSIIRDAALLLIEGSKHDEINILVNSPGGMVDTGLVYIQAMEQLRHRGITINCVSGVIAASMGFQILAHCDNVYALPNALLLFHPVAIGSAKRLTAEDLSYIHKQMVLVEQTMNDNLQSKFKFNSSYFDYHYKKETLHQAHELATRTRAITLVSDVLGIDGYLYKHSRPRSFFGWSDIAKIIYIKPSILSFIKGAK